MSAKDCPAYLSSIRCSCFRRNICHACHLPTNLQHDGTFHQSARATGGWLCRGEGGRGSCTERGQSVHSVAVQAGVEDVHTTYTAHKQYSTFCTGHKVQCVCRSCVSVSSGSSLAQHLSPTTTSPDCSGASACSRCSCTRINTK